MSVRSAIAVSLLCLSLWGCTGRRDNIAVRPLTPIAFAKGQAADVLLAEGRRLLAEGSNGAAMDHFRAVLKIDARSAPAENGLAVAYARLGRIDLAYRHSQLAVSYAPDNAAYRRNLEKLVGGAPREMVAMSALPVDVSATGRSDSLVSNDPGIALLKTGPRGPSLADIGSAGSVARSGPTLERLGARDVVLHTGAPGPAPRVITGDASSSMGSIRLISAAPNVTNQIHGKQASIGRRQ